MRLRSFCDKNPLNKRVCVQADATKTERIEASNGKYKLDCSLEGRNRKGKFLRFGECAVKGSKHVGHGFRKRPPF